MYIHVYVCACVCPSTCVCMCKSYLENKKCNSNTKEEEGVTSRPPTHTHAP